jgi:hypothetical protein
VTYAPEKEAVSFAGNRGSTRTFPVKYSAGPLTEGWDPAREIVCGFLIASAATAWLKKAPDDKSKESENSIAMYFIFSSPLYELTVHNSQFFLTLFFHDRCSQIRHFL